MQKIENPKWTAAKLIEMTDAGVGVIINYCGERFDVERAEVTEYGAVLIFNYHLDCHGLGSVNSEVEVLRTYNR